jgi:hypothetical protein
VFAFVYGLWAVCIFGTVNTANVSETAAGSFSGSRIILCKTRNPLNVNAMNFIRNSQKVCAIAMFLITGSPNFIAQLFYKEPPKLNAAKAQTVYTPSNYYVFYRIIQNGKDCAGCIGGGGNCLIQTSPQCT